MNVEPRPELDARFSGPDASPTPWPVVEGVLERAELFWISTVRPDGRPHVTPLPSVWLDETLHGEPQRLQRAQLLLVDHAFGAPFAMALSRPAGTSRHG